MLLRIVTLLFLSIPVGIAGFFIAITILDILSKIFS